MTDGEAYDPAQPRGSWIVFAVVAIPLGILYLITTFAHGPSLGDGLANAQTAFELGRYGDIFLEGDAVMPEPWMLPAGETTAVSQYPPGTALLATPLYAIWPGEPSYDVWRGPDSDGSRPEALRVRYGDPIRVPPRGPDGVIPALTTAIAIGLIAMVFRRFTSTRDAIGAGFVAGLATSAWPVATSQLWQHGPAMMWIAAGVALSRVHTGWSGAAFGLSILTRPHTALIAAGTGIGRSISERRWQPVAMIGAGSVLGLLLLVLYNYQVFGELTLSGGYGSAFTNNAFSTDLLPYLRNLWGAMFDGRYGLFINSPFLLLLLPGLVSAWRKAPYGVRGAAVGATLYLLLQYKANRFSGGDAFFGYRYPLEALIGLAPLLYLSYMGSIKDHRLFRWAFMATVVVSIGIQTIGVVAVSG